MLCVGVLLAVAPMTALAIQLLVDGDFTIGKPQPTLVAWKVDGGSFNLREITEGNVLELMGERRLAKDGSQRFIGRLIQTARIGLIPGRHYVFRVETRGSGRLQLGVTEFPDKYSPVRVDSLGEAFSLTSNWQSVSFSFVPTDSTQFGSPFFEVQGWLGRAELRHPSLESREQAGQIGIELVDAVVASGETVDVRITAEHGSVKLLLYGPAGVPPGPGGEYGGSDAWTDHFIQSQVTEVKSDQPVTVHWKIPEDAREGSYRVVAVDVVSGQTATASFGLYPPELAREFRSLADQIKLPEGARLLFLGDSLTDLFRGRNYVDLVTRALAQHHGQKVEVINAGVSGDSISKIEQRLEKDVIARNPTHVFLFEGANDCKRHFDPQTGLAAGWAIPRKQYEEICRRLLERLRAANIKVIVMTMAPGDQRILEPFRAKARTFGPAGNFFCLPDAAEEMVQLQKQLAAEFHLPIIDVNARFHPKLQDPAVFLHVDDGVHLSEFGNREVALAILNYLAGN